MVTVQLSDCQMSYTMRLYVACSYLQRETQERCRNNTSRNKKTIFDWVWPDDRHFNSYKSIYVSDGASDWQVSQLLYWLLPCVLCFLHSWECAAASLATHTSVSCGLLLGWILRCLAIFMEEYSTLILLFFGFLAVSLSLLLSWLILYSGLAGFWWLR